MHLRGRHYRTGLLVDVHCDGATISSVTPATDQRPNLEAMWIAPAFFDLQINGCDGIGFGSPDLTVEKVAHVTDVCHRHGIGQYFPTIITGSQEAILHGMTTLRRACEADAAQTRAIAGIHLEGPYLSSEDGPRGAHPRQHVRPADWNEFCRFQDAAGGRIRLITLAPESPGAIAFIEKAVRANITVAIGHTAAKRENIKDAIAAGATLSTHLGNGSHAVLPRHDNYLWEQLAADDLVASFISDGHHLPPAVLKCLIRCKTPSRLVLTCDAGPLAGLPPGVYRNWDQEFEVVASGKIVVPGTSFLAGSWAFTDLCVAKLLELDELTLGDAIDTASANPRQLLGLPPRTLEAGMPADLVLFDWPTKAGTFLRHTIVAGGPRT